jgi:hypothetical protein
MLEGRGFIYARLALHLVLAVVSVTVFTLLG